MITVEWLSANGLPLGVSPLVGDVRRTTVANGIGSASFVYPKSSSDWEDLTRYGQAVRIHALGQPSWAGAIVQRTWSAGAVQCDLKSAEWFLQKKLTGAGVAFPAGTSAGDIAAGLFAAAYEKNGGYALLRRGRFDLSQPRFVEPYHYADLYESIKKLAEESAGQFWVDAHFGVHLRARRGIDRAQLLREDVELLNVKARDSIDDAVTRLVVLGAGSSVVNKIVVARENPAYLNYHRAETLSADKITTPDELIIAADAEFAARSLPALFVDANLSDDVQVDVDDTVDLQLYSIPQDRPVRARVLGIEWITGRQRRVVLETIPTARVQSVVWTP